MKRPAGAPHAAACGASKGLRVGITNTSKQRRNYYLVFPEEDGRFPCDWADVAEPQQG